MARKKKEAPQVSKNTDYNAEIAGAGIVREMPITETLESNYMPYAMSVIVSRAIPEIDGFKPSHRKLLYTMYNMGLLKGNLIKSANIVGQTMRLNPHGDAAIYETMVRLARGNETLLHPYVKSKGNFGKAYSRDMAYAASRYTEASLEPICHELFDDIDKDTVDFVDNYDATTKEPTLLPTTFPTILTNSNLGIAVGMASSICSFNLNEIIDATVGLIRDEGYDVSQDVKAPDFPGGGIYLYDEEELKKIISTGRGAFKIRSVYNFDPKAKVIEITQIPPTTSLEAIIEKIIDLTKQKKITEIRDIRDESDLRGLKIAIEPKQGVDPDALMAKLFRLTPLQDSFSCNFNVLISGSPKTLGVADLLLEWIYFRRECVKRRTYFELDKLKARLHLLLGLQKILLDIDKAVKIVRETEEEAEVVPNLMIGFGIDKTQAEYVAEIKLRHLNREYILKRTAEIDELKDKVDELEGVLQSRRKIDTIIINELKAISKKYGQPRKTQISFADTMAYEPEEEKIADYEVKLFFTREGYFKKITPLSYRMGNVHKLKDGDEIFLELDSRNDRDLLVFSDRAKVYKTKAAAFDDTKASLMGDYLPAKLEFESDERAVFLADAGDYSGFMVFVFENGKVARVPMSAYETKTNRKKLINAYYDKTPCVAMFACSEETDLVLRSSNDKLMVLNTALIPEKTTKNTQGISAMRLNKGCTVAAATYLANVTLGDVHRYRSRQLPYGGAKLAASDVAEQLKLD